MQVLNISEAKAQLSAVIEQMTITGEAVVISRAGKPVAKVIPYKSAQQHQRLGLFEGQISIPGDFDTWPEDIAESLGIKQ